MQKNKIKDVYPLTPIEEGILFHSILSDESRNYFGQIILELNGRLEHEKIERSFNLLFERYDVLRAIYVYDKVKHPLKVIPTERYSKVEFFDLTDLDGETQEAKIEKYRLKDNSRGFDLAKDPLIRLAVFQLTKEQAKGIFTMHHILVDGWSTGILLNELQQIYHSLLNDLPLKLNQVSPYSNYIKWLDKRNKKEASNYWKKYLDGYESLAQVPPSYEGNSEDYKHGEYWFHLGKEISTTLKSLANQMQVTLNSLCQTAWGILLQRYNNTEDIVFGAVTTVRPSDVLGITQMPGVFINTIPVRINNSASKSFTTLVKDVQMDLKEAEQFAYYSLADIQSGSELKQNLFDHIMVFENYPIQSVIESIGEPFSLKKVKTYERTNYRFNIEFYPDEDLRVKILYNTELYDHKFIESIAGHVKKLMASIIDNPDIPVNAFDFIPKEELEQILYGLGGPTKDFPQEMTVYHYLEKEALKNPQKQALIYNDETLSYSELNARVNKFARFVLKYLLQMGRSQLNIDLDKQVQSAVRTEPLIAIMLERSPMMVEAILATWKTGGAYIPIDREYPVQRVLDILTDSGVKVLITKSSFVNEELRSAFLGEIIEIDNIEGTIKDANSENLDLVYNPNGLAYVIYTSGSTGKPKGAMVEHLGMMNHMHAKVNDLEMTKNSVVAQNASHCFDISVWQFFSSMLTGGKVIIYPKEITQDLEIFIEKIEKDRITVLEVVPSFMSVMIEHLKQRIEGNTFAQMRYLLVTGEVIKPNLVNRWFQLFPEVSVLNAYGPTEASDDITHFKMEFDPKCNTVPIGRPLPNFNIYITTPDMKLCPIGVKGEICVSGLGVGRGYLNNPDKTQNVFMEDPFLNEKGRRLYKTGDLGRYLPNGNIEFFGRKDYQVKIRGFRIELGEIESQLVRDSAIKEAVVIDRDDHEGNKYLVAYYVTDQELSIEHIKKNSLSDLPSYMIPSHFVRLLNIPLNSNGKIDRKALPEPKTSEMVVHDSFAGPTNEWEEDMSAIWSEVLGLSEVSIFDDFFELGGHSLKATQVVSRARKKWDIELKLKDLFNNPTIAMFSKLMQFQTSTFDEIISLPEREYYETSYSQKRIWMHGQLDEDVTIYNIVLGYLLEGSLNIDALNEALCTVVERHEILRANFKTYDGDLKFVINPSHSFNLQCEDLQNEDDWELVVQREAQKELRRVFDLEKGPLFVVKLLKISDNKAVIKIITHHIIFDGWSAGILIKEMLAIYRSILNGEKIALSVLPINYRDYAAWYTGLLSSDQMNRERSFWLNSFKDGIPQLNLMTDKPRPLQKTFNARKLRYLISDEVITEVKALSQKLGVTLFMTLLGAVQVLLAKYTKETEVVIGTDIAGRNREELEGLIGLFINTLALPLKIEPEDRFIDLVPRVKQVLLGAYEHQNYPFDQLVTDLKIKRDPARSPLFDVMVSMDNLPNHPYNAGGIKISEYPIQIERSYFELLFIFKEGTNGFTGSISYNTDLYRSATIELMQLRFQALLKDIAASPEKKIEELNYLTEEERSISSTADVEFDF
ncbi:non-ribosomal peptide synthetase [Chengkuizengella marina]|uniref:Amino acid adenylation domain-containing protein n=1 Tax=Chengkuizengella marina TaxID=2507566 RepID=A0A6N9Q7C4_9BACL|nr:non-ribosomal peptide synthetase [Chengkuizengella marina]NBI30766.1 amino acid adenylation domain-containing protein [Chengkuizengella marina]